MFKNKNKEDEVPKAIKKLRKENKQKEKQESKKKGKKVKRTTKTNKKNKANKKIKKIIIIIVIVLILLLGIFLGVSSHNWKQITQEMFVNETSIVVDSQGKTIAKLGSERKKIKINNEDIPKNLKNAYVAIEDERFYKHHGVDIKRTASAIFSYIIHAGSSSYGGSTITQQLVKNITGDNTDSVFRKVKEWWKAYQLEWYFSKDEILSTYLNVIYVGPNIYGVEAGAKYYFNKSAQQLSLAECAFLAGINNSPNSYNPFGEKDNKEKISKRTKIVLGKMKELEYINEEEYNSAISEVEKGLRLKKGNIESDDSVYSYHTDALVTEVISDISKKKNINKTFATNYSYMAGLTINSTQNDNIQKQTEKEFQKSKYSIASKQGGDPSQAAMVIIDHKTGQVLACVGGLGEKTTARGLNRATQSIRQTGSAIKPLAVLAPGIDKKLFTGATIYPDVEKTFQGGYEPKNYASYLGEITVRRALESSQNIPFVEMMEEIKPKKSIKYLKKMGITTLTEKDETLSLSLGGLDKGISPLEMAGAYATIANDGVYIEPTFYSSITNSTGEVVIKAKPKKKRVISEQVSYILKEILIQPVKGSNGTARYCAIPGIDVAAKTGTTDDNFDRWLCGFTPYYTAVTWFGYDQNETIFFNKQNPAGIIWSNVMKNIHGGLEKAEFKKPNWIESKTICAESGKIANSGCKETYTEYFLLGTSPKECDKHKGTTIKENSTTNSNTNNKVQNEGIFDDDIYEEKDAFDINRNENKTNNQSNSNQTNNNVENSTKPNNNNQNKNNTSSGKQNTTNTTNKQNTVNNTSNSSNKVNTTNTNKQNTATNTNSTNTSANILNNNKITN